MAQPYQPGKVRLPVQFAASAALVWQLLAASPAAADVALPAEGSAVAAPAGGETPRDLSKYNRRDAAGRRGGRLCDGPANDAG